MNKTSNPKPSANPGNKEANGNRNGIVSRIRNYFSNKKALKIALILCLCVFLCSLIYLGYILVMYINQRLIESRINSMFDDAKIHAEEIVPATPPPDITPEPDYDETDETDETVPEESEWDRERRLLLEEEARGRIIYADILGINGDFLGMIEIPGLIDRQPYVMSHDNAEYLNLDFNGNRNSTGTVFLNMFNDRLLMDNNSVLFGHYTETGDMFAKLLNYKNAATFKNSPTIILDGLIGESTWIVFAAFVVEPDPWWMIPRNEKGDYTQHLEEIQARNLFITDVDVTADDRIITLAVCDYTYEDMRFIVHARKLRPGEKAPESVIAEPNPDRKAFDIPHLNHLSDVNMTGAAFAVNPFSNRLFYYVPQAGYVDRFVGDARNIQGPFRALNHSGISSDKYMSAMIIREQDDPNPRDVYLAVQNVDNTQGISLFTAAMTTSTFSFEGLVTPEGVNARYPAIQNIDGVLWLLFSVPGDDGSSVLYRQHVRGGNVEQLYTVPGISDARPLGLYSVDGQTVALWYESGSGNINAARTGTGYVYNVANTWAWAHVMLYGSLSETSVKCVIEINGNLSFTTIDLSAAHSSDDNYNGNYYDGN